MRSPECWIAFSRGSSPRSRRRDCASLAAVLRRTLFVALQTPQVELHADVPDVRPYLAGCGMMAVPLRIGRRVDG